VRIAAVQSNYIPWKGYFDLINHVDAFVLLDEDQYTRRDWRNRNKIKVDGKLQWLTIPVAVKGNFHQRIDETLIAEPGWAEKHLRTLAHAYRRAPHFDATMALLEPLYLEAAKTERLSDVNRAFVDAICGALQITTPFHWSTDLPTRADRNLRLLDLALELGADEYLSGPAAGNYLDVDAFEREGVSVSWIDYSGYAEYPQGDGPFEHGVSIVDLLFWTGPEAGSYMKTMGANSAPFGQSAR
jgi:hypothetical protein